jgi:hypothetical protein
MTFDTPEMRHAVADFVSAVMASILPIGIEVWDQRDNNDLHRTKCRTQEEAFELLETAGNCPGMKGSVIWDHGRLVGIWDRDKGLVDLRSPPCDKGLSAARQP